MLPVSRPLTRSPGASSSSGSVVRLHSDLVRDTQLHCEWPGPGQTCHRRYDSAPQARRHRVLRSQVWRRQRELGNGTYGHVWLEKCVGGDDDRVKGKLRAVKQIAKNAGVLAAGDRFEFHRELEAIAKFSHKNYRHRFVRSFGWYESIEAVFIAMEYAEYGDLQGYMRYPLPESETCDIVSQVLDGLAFMHDNGFTHRDLKPGNILVFEQAPDWWVKITDFGITKRSQHEDGTVMRTMVGTRGYQAPEILGFFVEDALPAAAADHDEAAYTSAVDIWALGEITFRLFACKPAFSQRTLFDYVVKGGPFPEAELQHMQASQEMREFLIHTMAADPARRPSSRDALAMPWLANAAALAEGSPTQSSTILTPSISIDPSNLSLDDAASGRWSTVSHATAVNHSRSASQNSQFEVDDPFAGAPYPAPLALSSMSPRPEETTTTNSSSSSWPHIDTPPDSMPPPERQAPTPVNPLNQHERSSERTLAYQQPPEKETRRHAHYGQQSAAGDQSHYTTSPPPTTSSLERAYLHEQEQSNPPISSDSHGGSIVIGAMAPATTHQPVAGPEAHSAGMAPVVSTSIVQDFALQPSARASSPAYPTLMASFDTPRSQDFALQPAPAAPSAPPPEPPRTEHVDPAPAPYSITFTPVSCTCEHCATRPSLFFHKRTCVMPGQTGRVSARRHSDLFPAVTEGFAQDLYFKSKVISRDHCRFMLDGGKWYVQDTKSSSGTFLNGVRLSRENKISSRRRLHDGDVVQLGVRFTKFEGEDTPLMWPVRMVVNLNGGQASKWSHAMLVLKAGPSTDEDGTAAEPEGRADAPATTDDGNSRDGADASGSDDYASPDDNRRRRRLERLERSHSNLARDAEAERAKPKENIFKRFLRITPNADGRSETRYV